MNWKGARDYILARMAEKTTWGGIVTLATAAGGVALKPQHAELIAFAGTGLGSVLLILLKENGSQK